MRPHPFSSGIFLIVALATVNVRSQSIDDIIVGSFETVEEFGRLADISGNVIRQEMDMLLVKEQALALKTLEETESAKDDPKNIRKRRKAIRSLRYRWSDNIIPYSIAKNVFSDADKNQIMSAINEWQQHTCIRFRPANSNDNNKIHFDNGKGCYSYVGMISGSQQVGLAKGCRFKGVIVHEIGHAVGFHHEQNRPDRDDYVRILEDNIPSHLLYNFKKYPTSAVDTMDVPYDYTSVMHYGGRAFTKNGQYTIRTRNPKDQNKIGNRKGLSFNDIMLANKMYKCSDHCDRKPSCPAGAFLGKDCKCMCPGYPVTECGSSGSVATTTAQPSQGTTLKPCRDANRRCPSWAAAGYCARNTFVRTYCKESCGFCSDSKPTTRAPACRDTAQHCTSWGRLGYCQGRFEFFMSENCAKTCKICGSTNENPGGDPDNSSPSLQYSLAALFVCSFYSLVMSRFQ